MNFNKQTHEKASPAEELCFFNCTASNEILTFDTQEPQDCLVGAHHQLSSPDGSVIVLACQVPAPQLPTLSTETSGTHSLSVIRKPPGYSTSYLTVPCPSCPDSELPIEDAGLLQPSDVVTVSPSTVLYHCP